MLYDEFVKGTGCRETENNYKVYQRVEMLYMADDSMTKEEAYDIGKMWVNNDLTDEEIAHNEEVYAEIEEWDDAIRRDKERIADIKERVRELKAELKNWQGYLVADTNNRDAAKLKLITV